MSTRYRQYILSRSGDTPGAKKTLTTWLPERKAGRDIVAGCELTLSHEPGVWWQVDEMSDVSLAPEEVSAMLTRARRFGPSLREEDRTA